MARCSFKKGLLNLRDCGEPAEDYCSQCNRPICRQHIRQMEGAESGCLCPECAAKFVDGKVDQEAWYATNRRRFYHNSGYFPIYFGHQQRYGDEEYRYFDPNHDNPYLSDTKGMTAIDREEYDSHSSLDADDFQDS